MKCIKCKSTKLKVIDSRPWGDCTRRIRKCKECGTRYNTIEYVSSRKN